MLIEEAVVEADAGVNLAACTSSTRNLGSPVVQIEVPAEGLRVVEEECAVEACTIGKTLVRIEWVPVVGNGGGSVANLMTDVALQKESEWKK